MLRTVSSGPLSSLVVDASNGLSYPPAAAKTTISHYGPREDESILIFETPHISAVVMGLDAVTGWQTIKAVLVILMHEKFSFH